jgi:hypothetical protein
VDWGVAASLAVFLVVGVLLGFVGVAKYTFTMSLLGMG